MLSSALESVNTGYKTRLFVIFPAPSYPNRNCSFIQTNKTCRVAGARE